MTTHSAIGIFGGTFDPIQFGHLRVAFETWQTLKLDHVRFIPCKQHVFKSTPQATEQQRLQMLSLALQNHPQFVIDQRELQRDGISYMVDTLQSLRDEFSDQSLCLIMGTDVFADLDQWYQWQKLLRFAHIVVAHRPNFDLQFSAVIADLLANYQTSVVTDLHKQICGKIFLQEVTALDISASRIRHDLARGLKPEFLLPNEVVEFIVREGIYR